MEQVSATLQNECMPPFKAAVDLEEEDENPDDDRGDSESDSCACVSVFKEHEFELVEDQIERDVFCAFLSSGWDVEDESIAEERNICVHDELFPFNTCRQRMIMFTHCKNDGERGAAVRRAIGQG